MTTDERNVVLGTVGLALVALGAFLPWARIGGRNRSGFDTADTFIALASGALPDAIAWVGRWWYLPAFLICVAWATTFARGHWALRAAGVVLISLAAAMWWLFVWAGERYNVLNTQLVGPIVATIGMALVATACGRSRGSMLRPAATEAQAERPI